MTKTETVRRINSEQDAWEYWEEEYGSPKFFSAFTELTDVEIKLADLQLEQEKVNREIQARDVERMNEFIINRAIELHFLIVVGALYFEQCIRVAGKTEEALESEFSRDFTDDDLFTRKFED